MSDVMTAENEVHQQLQTLSSDFFYAQTEHVV
jgi:hypothetical protein